MARLNYILLITLLVLTMHSLSSQIDAQKILKMETQEVSVHASGASGRLIARLANNERVLVSSHPSPGGGHQ